MTHTLTVWTVLAVLLLTATAQNGKCIHQVNIQLLQLLNVQHSYGCIDGALEQHRDSKKGPDLTICMF